MAGKEFHRARTPGQVVRGPEGEEEQSDSVRIPVGRVVLDGERAIPAGACGMVLFAHGSGSSRHSPRNQFVAGTIRKAGLATLLFDLLTGEEEASDAVDGHLRFDIPLLARRLTAVTRWVSTDPVTRHLRPGYFGSSTGGAAALIAAAELGAGVGAVVSRGGRPDLAGDSLPRVISPTLLIVGARDDMVRQLNEDAFARLTCEKRLVIVPRATHLFEEPGTLEIVAELAASWFREHLEPRGPVRPSPHGGNI